MTRILMASMLLVCAGCGLNVQGNYQRIRPKLVSHDYNAAAAAIEASRGRGYSQDNRLLYLMDKGMVLHLAKRYAESNVALEAAKVAAQELWTESIGAHAAAWMTTDNSLPYQGEDFERVLIHFIAALNHMGLDDFSAARVEARQVTSALELYNSKYEAKNVYRDDAFSRWLSGRLAETDDDMQALNDAWIDYRKALKVYETDYAKRYNMPLPTRVVSDALRVTQELGPDFAEEHASLRAKYPSVAVPDAKQSRSMGRVVLLHLNGEAPYKVDRFWTAPVGADLVRVAYPAFVPKRHAIVRAQVRVLQTGDVVFSEKMEDIAAIATQNLADHMGRIQAKAIARATAKVLAGKSVRAAGKARADQAGDIMQIAASVWNVAHALAEEADKRSWITLPATVTAAEVVVPPGPVTLDVDFLNASGQAVERVRLQGDAKAGGTTFMTYRTFR